MLLGLPASCPLGGIEYGHVNFDAQVIRLADEVIEITFKSRLLGNFVVDLRPCYYTDVNVFAAHELEGHNLQGSARALRFIDSIN